MLPPPILVFALQILCVLCVLKSRAARRVVYKICGGLMDEQQLIPTIVGYLLWQTRDGPIYLRERGLTFYLTHQTGGRLGFKKNIWMLPCNV